MNVEKELRSAVVKLRSGLLEKEEQVKVSIISPILRALDWDYTDPKVCRMEYSVKGGAVDYALLHHDRAQIFIEAKRYGAMDDGARSNYLGMPMTRGFRSSY